MQVPTQESDNRTAQVIDRRYDVLHVIGSGGMGTVFAVRDRLTRQMVALKRVSTQTSMIDDTHNVVELRETLAKEFATLASLRHPNIISVLDYGFDDGQPYFTMELVSNPLTITQAAATVTATQKMDYLIQMLQALAYLHRRGIIHRDLKPGNALLDGDQVKVLDFGLATLQASRSDEDVANNVVGTLAYIAPEALRGESVSIQSDLYAAGVIAYEMFAGKHPFEINDVTGLIRDIVMTPPDVNEMDTDVSIQWIVQRLLEKEPEDRYPDAQTAIQRLSEVIGLSTTTDTSIRESFLQGAQFIGRGDELRQLENAFKEAQDGQGTAWLVGGESGVGKSRLLDEFRIRALVTGATVLRGNAVQDGGRLYQAWVEILRQLVLVVMPDETAASILKLIMPDLDSLLGYTIPDAPELDPQATRERLVVTIAQLFSQVQTPMVVLLEDLQWAHESLEVIEYLSRRIIAWPVLFIGSYRSDERPTLLDELPNLVHIQLQPLHPAAIAQLSVAMLGDNGNNPNVVSLLQEETEGNIYFIIEVVRALVEESGQMSQVGQATIPQHMFTGGLAAIVERRLSQMSRADRRLLNFAAIYGREVDTTLMEAAYPEINVGEWLLRANESLVLQVRDNRWWFAHDKLREGTLKVLSPEEKIQYHAQVAETVEVLYANDPEQVVNLAYHWREAHNPAKELTYAQQAGQQILDNGLPEVAIDYLNRALELCEQVAVTDQQRADIVLLLGNAEQEVGKGDIALDHIVEALSLFGETVPQATPRQVFGMLRQAGIQFLHRRMPKRYYNIVDADERDYQIRIARAWQLISLISFINQKPMLALYGSLKALNMGELSGPSDVLVQAYVSISVLTGTVLQNEGLSAAYYERSKHVANTINRKPEKALINFSRGFYLLGRGEWEAAEDLLIQGIELYESVGDRRWYTQTSIHQTYTHYYRGQLAFPKKTYVDLLKLSEERRDPQAIQWTLLGMLRLALIEDDRSRAAQIVYRLEYLLQDVASFDEPTAILTNGGLARYYLYAGQPERAEEFAQIGHEIIKNGAPPSLYYVYDGYYSISEVWLTLWEQTGNTDYIPLVKQSLKHLKTFSGTFPIGKPRLLLHQAWMKHLEGKSDDAHKLWLAAYEAAQALNMPIEAGLAQYHRGRTMPDTDPDRANYLQSAKTIFEKIGVKAYLGWVEALEEKPSSTQGES